MTADFIFKKSAGIYENQDFINVFTMSGYRMLVADADQKNEYLPVDVSDTELGKCLKEALSLSRCVHPIEQKELSLYLKNLDRDKERFEHRMKKYNYKTKQQMFKKMRLCCVELHKGKISIMPWHHYKLENWDRTGLTELDDVGISESCSDVELGDAVRLALSRCTSKYE